MGKNKTVEKEIGIWGVRSVREAFPEQMFLSKVLSRYRT